MASYLSSVFGSWKPPKGVGGVAGMAALPCFRQLSAVSPCALSEEDACSFCSSLCEDLKMLDRSLGESAISLRWSAEALSVLKKMHVDLLALFSKSKLPISFGAEEDWFDQYMKETATLLDLCNSLISAVSGIGGYRIAVDLAVQKIQSDPAAATANEVEFGRLERDCKVFMGIKKWRDPIRPNYDDNNNNNGASSSSPPPSEPYKCEKKGVVGAVMLAVKSVTVVLSLILVSVFISPVSIDVGDEQLIRKEFPQLRQTFAAALTALASRFRKMISRRSGSGGIPGMVLAEQETVEKLVGDLKSQVAQGPVEDSEEFSRGVRLLREKSLGLKEGIDLFDSVVNEVFEVVVKGRNELLGAFRDVALT